MGRREGKVTAIVPGGGSGKRMGESIPKQYLSIAGKPIIIHTLEKLDRCSLVDEVILVVPETYTRSTQNLIQVHHIRKVNHIVPGGRERQDSIRNAFKFISDDTEIVFTHDVVRPFVRIAKINELIETARDEGAAILATREKCTVKRVLNGRVTETLDRSDLWQIQTPQAFQKDLLFKAYDQAEEDGFYGTDDAMLVERLGHPVYIVESDDRNIKITSPDDMILAEALMLMENDA